MPRLDMATAVLLGESPVDAMYARDTQVWPAGSRGLWGLDSFGMPELTISEAVPGSGSAQWEGNGVLLASLTNVAPTNAMEITWPVDPMPHPSGLTSAPLDATGWNLTWEMEIVGNLGTTDIQAYAYWEQVDTEANYATGGYVFTRAVDGAPSAENGALLPWTQGTPTDVHAADMYAPDIAGTNLGVGRWYIGLYYGQVGSVVPPTVNLRVNTRACQWYAYINTPPSVARKSPLTAPPHR